MEDFHVRQQQAGERDLGRQSEGLGRRDEIDFPPNAGTSHPFGEINVAWYDEGCLKISVAHGTPDMIRQAHLTGADPDLVIEVERD